MLTWLKYDPYDPGPTETGVFPNFAKVGDLSDLDVNAMLKIEQIKSAQPLTRGTS